MRRADAQKAVDELDNMDWGGSIIKVGWSKPVPVPTRAIYGKPNSSLALGVTELLRLRVSGWVAILIPLQTWVKVVDRPTNHHHGTRPARCHTPSHHHRPPELKLAVDQGLIRRIIAVIHTLALDQDHHLRRPAKIATAVELDQALILLVPRYHDHSPRRQKSSRLGRSGSPEYRKSTKSSFAQ